eukprot:1195529-Prorocentrum_minimum.AAC.2
MARLMALSDMHTDLPSFTQDCTLDPEELAVTDSAEYPCLDFVEVYRAGVEGAQLSLARLRALAHLLETEARRGWSGHVVVMDTDMLLLQVKLHTEITK